MPRVVQLKMQRIEQQLFDLAHQVKTSFVIALAARRLHRVQQVDELVIDIRIACATKLHLGLTFGGFDGVSTGFVGGDTDIAWFVGAIDA